MITLFQPPAVWGIPNMSPFCVKLETYLRMAKIPYECKMGNPVQAPKGKIPYVEIDGKLMGDSALIIEKLKKSHGDPLDSRLTVEQRAQGLALQRLVEEHMYFATAWIRWSDDSSYAHVKKLFLKILPPVVGSFIMKKIRKDFLKSIHAQGVGRHTREEILAMAKEDLQAISVLLGQRPYFFGSEPSSIDAMLYGFLIQLMWVPWESDLTKFTKGLPNLEPYCNRIKQKYWA